MDNHKQFFIIFLLFGVYSCSMDSFIMMPFKTFNHEGQLINRDKLISWLTVIKENGFKGVTMDFWWGIIELQPRSYQFEEYIKLIEEIKNIGLKVKVILSFHSCGNTIGDDCYFPLPQWVLDSGSSFFYMDQNGSLNHEYISIFADDLKLKDQRTVLEAYEDFISEFNNKFKIYYGNVIVNIELGVGPAGQLHYPSYSYKNGFCNIGFFQWYGEVATKSFQAFLKNISLKEENSDLSTIGNLHVPTLKQLNIKPHQEYFFQALNLSQEKCTNVREKEDCGNPETKQHECFQSGCCWQEVEGEPFCFFPRQVYNYKANLGIIYQLWYQEEQLKHLQRILTIGRKVLGFGIPISVKLPCIHWFVNDHSRAAERTAGFMINTNEGFTIDVRQNPYH
jgi:hypothetical protein